MTKTFFSGSFLGHAVQQVNLSSFLQALTSNAHKTRLTFELEIDTTQGHSSSFRTRSHECRWQGWRVYPDPCPRAREVACLVLWSSVASSQNSVFRPLGDDRELLSQLSTHQPPNVFFNRSLLGARHKSPAVEWALYTKGGSEPLTSSPRLEFTTMSLISSNEVCGKHEIAPRLIHDLLEKYLGRCWPRSPREITSGKFQK